MKSRSTAATPAAPRAPSVSSPRGSAQHVRTNAQPPESRRFRRGRVCGEQGAWACFRDSGINRDAAGDDTGQKEAPREPCAAAAAREGNPRPPARDGARGAQRRRGGGRTAAARGGGAHGRGVQRSVHFLFGARRPPQRCAPGACVRAGPGPRCLSVVPGTAARRRRPPLSSQARASRSRTCARGRATAQLRRGLAFAPPPARPPPLPPGRTAPVPGSGWLTLRPRIVFICQLPPSRQSFHFGTGEGGWFSQSPFLTAPASPDHLWESGGGAEWVGNVASLRKRRKTLSPSWRRLPRVTRRERETRTRTASGFLTRHLASPSEEKDASSALTPTAIPLGRRAAARATCSALPPRGSPHAVSSRGRTVTTSARLGADGRGRAGKGRERTVFQARVTRN